MIHVERVRQDERGVTIQPEPSWFHSAREATARALAEGQNHVANRDVYGHPQVTAAIEEIFHGKCAYCESKITNAEWDVEHFRPKGRVAERGDHPGYYWLAYTWTNLYPSCKLCNQKRRGRPRWRDFRWTAAAGKQDQFPLEDEATRAMTPGDDLLREKTLLIDPCRAEDEPSQYLIFTIDGEILSKSHHPKGDASISVFNLKRPPLCIERKTKIAAVVAYLKLIGGLEAKGQIAASVDFLKLLERFYLSDACEYAGAARCVLRDPAAFGV